MHILEIPSFFPPYGGLFCLDQAKALKGQGHEVRILSNVQLGATIGLRDYVVRPYHRFEHQMDGITVYQHFQRGVPHMVRHNVERWVATVLSMYDDYVERYGQPDILHAHCAKWAGYAAMMIGRQSGVPYVITEHLSRRLYEAEFGPAPSNAWQIPLLKDAYHEARIVIPVAEELVDDVACYFGKDYRWHSLSNTVDTQFFAFRQRPAAAGRPFCFCCIANYTSLKGYDVLFQAFRQLQAAGHDVQMRIAGAGTDSRRCRQDMETTQLQHIEALGQLDREGVRSLLYQSDALVLASRSEVQPLVVLEALSTGLPVVATESVPRSLRIEGGCTIVPKDDADQLAQAMAQLVVHPMTDGQRWSEQVRAMASPQEVGQQLTAIFSEALASR